MIGCDGFSRILQNFIGTHYEYEAPESFHVSMACVEPQSASGGATSIYLIRDNGDPEEREVLICTLRSVIIKCKIDL